MHLKKNCALFCFVLFYQTAPLFILRNSDWFDLFLGGFSACDNLLTHTVYHLCATKANIFDFCIVFNFKQSYYCELQMWKLYVVSGSFLCFNRNTFHECWDGIFQCNKGSTIMHCYMINIHGLLFAPFSNVIYRGCLFKCLLNVCFFSGYKNLK